MELKVNKSKGVDISEDMYGLFFEDINYSLDGGLYAQMLENRNFEAVFAYGKRDDFHTVYDGKYAWHVYQDDGAGSSIYMDSVTPLNDVNPHYMVFDGRGVQPSFTNQAYDGIYLKKGMTYEVSFYAKPIENGKDVLVSIQKDGVTYAKESVCLDSKDWKKYELTLTAKEDVKQADFVVSLEEAGVVCFDYFSMIPQDAVCGIFRKDLVEKLAVLQPSFMRFPGGCIVEGNTLANRYKWKDTIAPVEERKFNWNRWAVHNNNENTGFSGPYPHYGQTYGVGYYEYFLLCEELQMKALPVMNVGLACQFMSSETVDFESDAMQEYIQDALDLIEFANGSEDTVWGAKRVAMGHKESFNLEYLGVGNEQWQTEEVQFFKRYEMFEEAIHKKYPDIKIIGTAGADVWGGGYFAAWDWAREAIKENPNFMYAMDEHYYVAPDWLYEHTHFYDDYDRSLKVFAGEYACHIKERAGKMNFPSANTLEAAIAEAAFLTGVERNADVVRLASYAPLFARMGYTQWSPNLIWFDGEASYETPSYWVQYLYSRYRGVKTVSVDFGLNKEEELREKLYASGVLDEDGRLILKLVNGSDSEKEITVKTEDDSLSGDFEVEVIRICGEKDDQNTIKEKEKVLPVKTRQQLKDGVITLPKNSFTVVLF